MGENIATLERKYVEFEFEITRLEDKINILCENEHENKHEITRLEEIIGRLVIKIARIENKIAMLES